MNKFKKYVNVFVYSYNTCKKYSEIFLPVIIIISIASLSLPLLQNYFAKYVVSSIALKTDMASFLKTIVIWTISLLAIKTIEYIANYYFTKKSRVLRNRIFQQINHIRMDVRYELTLDSDYQKKLSIARSVMDRNIPCVVGIQNSTITFIVDIISLFIYTSLITKLHWGILVIYVSIYAAELLINIRHTKFVRDFRDRLIPLQRKIAYVAGRSGDIKAAKDVRVYNMSKWFSHKYMDFGNEKAEIIDQREKINHRNRIKSAFLTLVRNIASYIFLLLMYCNGKIEISDFVFFIGVIATFSSVLSNLQGNIQNVYNNYLEVKDYIDFENCSNCVTNTEKKLDLPKEINTIEFVNVSYCYPGSSYEILSNVDLLLRINEKTGLVGLNGAGKTTLVLLMCGLLKPTKGKILMNGVDISNYEMNAYTNLFSAVFQDISVLPDSVLNNIGMKTEYTDEQIKKIEEITLECGLEKINLKSKFIKEIFDDAICLSGGEMQKIALARAVFKTAQVLILDEPTASLDPLAEQQLYLNYGKFSENKISMFISHRLASTTFCDNIVMLDHGTIIENGNHNQLMRQNGKYKELFETQRKYYKKKLMEADCL